MRPHFRWFVYASLAFLAIYLARRGWLEVPTIASLGALGLSLPPLLMGFLASSQSWRKVLAGSGFESRFRECLASMGLSAFGKYIPGKLWILLGRAKYIADARKLPLTAVSAASVNDQLISLWAGAALGGAGLIMVGGSRLHGPLLFGVWIFLSAAVLSPWALRVAERIGRLVFGRTVSLPALDLRSALAVLPWALTSWSLWSVGFLLFVRSLSPSPVNWSVGLAFPLAGTLGIMAVVAPGGLGVREGVMAGYLLLVGFSAADAATISVASRLWFLVGETLFFIAGLLAHGGVAASRGVSPGD